MSEKLLTIGIPNYNSPDTLRTLLDILKKEDAEFEILVSDNSTNSGVGNLVREYMKEMPNLTYNKNKVDIGYSGNILKIYELAKTKYIWYCCDDDEIIPGSVSKMISDIKKYKPSVMCVGTEWVDVLGRNRVAAPKKDMVYNSLDELPNYQPVMRLTFVSLMVVEKTIPLTEIEKTNYSDNVFVQLTIALHLLSHRFKYVETAGAAIRRFVGFKYGEFYKFLVVDEMKAIHAVKHKFNNKKFISWYRTLLWENFVLYMSRKIGLFSYTRPPTEATIKLLFQYFGVFALLQLSFIPVYALTPRFVVAVVYQLTLFFVHGVKKGREIYEANVNRAYTDKRDDVFVSYK